MRILRDYLETVALYSNRIKYFSISSNGQLMVRTSFCFLLFIFIMSAEDAVIIVLCQK